MLHSVIRKVIAIMDIDDNHVEYASDTVMYLLVLSVLVSFFLVLLS